MGNTSIYIKNQPLLQRAKKLAGDEGFSAFMEKALADFVERKLDESRGLTDHSILVDPSIAGLAPDHTFARLIRFKGRSLATTELGQGTDFEGADAEVYQTRAGRLILVLRELPSGDAYDHRVYESLEKLADDEDAFEGLTPTQRHEFIDRVAQAMGEKWAEWID